MATDEELAELIGAADEAAAEASALLDDELEALLEAANQLNELKPDTADDASYAQLMAVIQQASAHNESVATLKANIASLGKGAITLAKGILGKLA